MKKFILRAVAMSSLSAAGLCHATTLSFSAEDGKLYLHPVTFADQGVTFSYSQKSPSAFARVGNPVVCTPDCTGNGVEAFYSYNDGTLSFAATNGASFSLQSLQLAQTFLDDRPLDVLITGSLPDGATVSEEIKETTDEDKVFNTFVLPASFQGVSEVSITGVGPNPTSEFAVDGITVSGVSSVPELPSSRLLVAGLAASVALSRRRCFARR